jgi:hypothetical protein
MIVSNKTDKIYIGSTKKYEIEKRMSEHKNNAKYWTEGKTHYTSSFEIIKFGDAKIKLIESYPCYNKTQLLMRERYYIDLYRDLCVNIQTPIHTEEERKENKIIYEKRKECEELQKLRENKNYMKNKCRLLNYKIHKILNLTL